MKFTKKLLSLMLAVMMILVSMPVSNAVTFDHINQNRVFMNQPAYSVTCTLYATAMMMRRYSWIRGDANWSAITPDSIYSTAWGADGLNRSFHYHDDANGIYYMSVEHAYLPEDYTKKKEFLISLLNSRPEGVVIYKFWGDTQHAVLLTDYTDGQFYIADPSWGNAAARIPISEASSGVSISSVTRYWYIASPSVGLTVAGPHTCDKDFYIGPGDTHPHNSYYYCSICGKNWRDYDSSNYMASCSQCVSGPHTCDRGIPAGPGDTHPHNSYYYCSICGANWRDWDSSNYVASCSECVNGTHTCDKGTWLYFGKSHPHSDYYRCSICGKDWMDSTSSNYYSSCSTCNENKYPTISTGYYTLTNVGSGSILNISGGVDANQTNVTGGTWNPPHQRLYITPASTGYKMRPVCSNSRLINAWGASPGDGSNVNLYDNCNESSQWWIFEEVNGGYIVRLAYNTSLVLTYLASSNNVAVATYAEGDTRQIWKLDPANVYTVLYNANGGTGVPADQTKYQGKDIILSTTVPTMQDCEFKEWNTEIDGSGESYAAGAVYSKDENVILHAQWRVTGYLVLRSDSELNMSANSPHIWGDVLPGIDVETLKSHFENDNVVIKPVFANRVGTGTKVQLVADDVVIEEREIIVFGDINGDGQFDGQDAVYAECLINGMLTYRDIGELAYEASDCNFDGVLDELDIEILASAGLKQVTVRQQ